MSRAKQIVANINHFLFYYYSFFSINLKTLIFEADNIMTYFTNFFYARFQKC